MKMYRDHSHIQVTLQNKDGIVFANKFICNIGELLLHGQTETTERKFWIRIGYYIVPRNAYGLLPHSPETLVFKGRIHAANNPYLAASEDNNLFILPLNTRKDRK